MPFTISHTVAVIPLYKYLGKFGALSALIIGSMTPDFAYLTPYLVHQRMDSHSLLGVYLYAIPMGLTVYFLYHLLMAPVIVSLFPQALKKYLHEDLFVGRLPDIPSYALIFSLVLGALTHILWDFFTHQSGLPQFIHWMDVPLTSLDGYDIMPYRVLQHFSSLFGLTLLIFWIWQWVARKKSKPTIDSNTLNAASNHWQASKKLILLSKVTLLIVPAIVGIMNGIRYLPETGVMYGLYDAQVFIRFAIIGAAAAFIICCALLGLVYQLQISRIKPD